MNISLIEVFSYIFLIYGCVVLTPALGGGIILKLFILVAMLLVAVAIAFKSRCTSRQGLFCVSLITSFYLYCLLLSVTGFSSAAMGRYANLFGFLAPLAIFYLIGNSFQDYRFGKKAIYLTIFIVLVVVTSNLKALFDNPSLLIKMNFVETDVDEYFNIANTLQGAAWTLLGLMLLQVRDVSNNVKFIVLAIIGTYCLISSKTTILLLFGFCLVVMIVGRLSFKISLKSIGFTMLVASISVSIAIVYIPMLNEIGYFDQLFNRLTALDKLLFGARVSAETVRLELAYVSIKTFISNPVIGVGYDFVDLMGDANEARASGVGHHSEVIDFLARFGLVGFFVFWLILKPFFISLLSHREKSYTLFPILIFIIMYSLLNNVISFEFGLVIFMILPIFSRYAPGNLHVTKKSRKKAH
jgi:hypothetical protein